MFMYSEARLWENCLFQWRLVKIYCFREQSTLHFCVRPFVDTWCHNTAWYAITFWHAICENGLANSDLDTISSFRTWREIDTLSSVAWMVLPVGIVGRILGLLGWFKASTLGFIPYLNAYVDVRRWTYWESVFNYNAIVNYITITRKRLIWKQV
jgi:hypothetical protein